MSRKRNGALCAMLEWVAIFVVVAPATPQDSSRQRTLDLAVQDPSAEAAARQAERVAELTRMLRQPAPLPAVCSDVLALSKLRQRLDAMAVALPANRPLESIRLTSVSVWLSQVQDILVKNQARIDGARRSVKLLEEQIRSGKRFGRDVSHEESMLAQEQATAASVAAPTHDDLLQLGNLLGLTREAIELMVVERRAAAMRFPWTQEIFDAQEYARNLETVTAGLPDDAEDVAQAIRLAQLAREAAERIERGSLVEAVAALGALRAWYFAGIDGLDSARSPESRPNGGRASQVLSGDVWGGNEVFQYTFTVRTAVPMPGEPKKIRLTGDLQIILNGPRFTFDGCKSGDRLEGSFDIPGVCRIEMKGDVDSVRWTGIWERRNFSGRLDGRGSFDLGRSTGPTAKAGTNPVISSGSVFTGSVVGGIEHYLYTFEMRTAGPETSRSSTMRVLGEMKLSIHEGVSYEVRGEKSGDRLEGSFVLPDCTIKMKGVAGPTRWSGTWERVDARGSINGRGTFDLVRG